MPGERAFLHSGDAEIATTTMCKISEALELDAANAEFFADCSSMFGGSDRDAGTSSSWPTTVTDGHGPPRRKHGQLLPPIKTPGLLIEVKRWGAMNVLLALLTHAGVYDARERTFLRRLVRGWLSCSVVNLLSGCMLHTLVLNVTAL